MVNPKHKCVIKGCSILDWTVRITWIKGEGVMTIQNLGGGGGGEFFFAYLEFEGGGS